MTTPTRAQQQLIEQINDMIEDAGESSTRFTIRSTSLTVIEYSIARTEWTIRDVGVGSEIEVSNSVLAIMASSGDLQRILELINSPTGTPPPTPTDVRGIRPEEREDPRASARIAAINDAAELKVALNDAVRDSGEAGDALAIRATSLGQSIARSFDSGTNQRRTWEVVTQSLVAMENRIAILRDDLKRLRDGLPDL